MFAILGILRRWLTLAWEKCEPFTNMVFIFIFIEVSLGTCVFSQTGYSRLQMCSLLDVCEKKAKLGPAARTTTGRLVLVHFTRPKTALNTASSLNQNASLQYFTQALCAINNTIIYLGNYVSAAITSSCLKFKLALKIGVVAKQICNV